jgi:hypothetical protein
MISGVYLALPIACSAEHHDKTPDPSQTQSCTNWIQRLVDCKIIAGHRVSGCDDTSYKFPCLWDCTQKATCAQMKGWYCNSAFNSYSGCLNECDMLPIPFTCDDGSRIDLSKACDGVADCPNGEDEDCTQGYIACDDGTMVPERDRCDGSTDCADGSDEVGCPPGPMFLCDSGDSIPADHQCNGAPDCPDGSDEFDCASKTCDN